MTSARLNPSVPLGRRSWIAPVLIFAIALAVRIYHLSYHSLWFDEVMSTFWAAKPTTEIWRVGLALSLDKHPPLYYLLLHGWSAVFGGGDVAVRAFGALIGAFAVLPAYGMGVRLGDRRAAAIGSLLIALNPFLIWYSQEARMFMPATTFILLGLYGVLALADDERRQRRAGWLPPIAWIMLGFTAALYTYLFSAFILPVAAIWIMVLAWRARRTGDGARIALPGLLSLGLVGLLFLPLARSAWLVSGTESAAGRPFSGMLSSVWHLAQIYALGWPPWPESVQQLLAAAAILLAVAGLILGLGGTGRFAGTRKIGGWLLAVWLVLPLLAGGLLLARDGTIFGETRYFIFLAPALCLSWGRALSWAWTRSHAAGIVGLALVLGVTLACLPYLWSPENRKEAWRETAAFIEAHAGANDAILIEADYVHPAFERYFRGQQPIFYPFTDRLTGADQVDAPLAGLSGFDAVWLVQSHQQEFDPEGLVAGWFANRYPEVTEVFPSGIAVRGYLQRYRLDEAPPGISVSGDVEAAGPHLASCTYQPNRLKPTDDLFHPPSNWIHVTTYWTPGGLPDDFVPAVQLVDDAGQVWGQSLDRAGDTFRRWPPSKWQSGEVVRADHDVNLNPVTPAGTYQLVIAAPGLPELSWPCGEVEITK